MAAPTTPRWVSHTTGNLSGRVQMLRVRTTHLHPDPLTSASPMVIWNGGRHMPRMWQGVLCQNIQIRMEWKVFYISGWSGETEQLHTAHLEKGWSAPPPSDWSTAAIGAFLQVVSDILEGKYQGFCICLNRRLITSSEASIP